MIRLSYVTSEVRGVKFLIFVLQKKDLDLQSQALDTLFVLARTALVAQDTRSYNPAFEFLTRATGLLGLSDLSGALQTDRHANFARCISGAFYNLAGMLYQESRWGHTVRFLKETCTLGCWALKVHKSIDASESVEEHWTNLEHQLYRRWELLAVCYLKIGDRQVSFAAFDHRLFAHSMTSHSSHSMLSFRQSKLFHTREPISLPIWIRVDREQP